MKKFKQRNFRNRVVKGSLVLLVPVSVQKQNKIGLYVSSNSGYSNEELVFVDGKVIRHRRDLIWIQEK